MNCPNCQNETRKRGKDRKGNQRFYCAVCFKSFIGPQDKPLDSMYLPIEKAIQCIHQLVEGCSLRSTERITGVSLHTILNLLTLVGSNCERLLDERIQNVPVKDVGWDETWCSVSMKEKTLKAKVSEGKFQDDLETVAKIGDP